VSVVGGLIARSKFDSGAWVWQSAAMSLEVRCLVPRAGFVPVLSGRLALLGSARRAEEVVPIRWWPDRRVVNVGWIL